MKNTPLQVKILHEKSYFSKSSEVLAAKFWTFVEKKPEKWEV